MKKFDIKKVGIVVAIIVVVVLAIFLIGKLLKGNVDEESLKQYEKVTIEYYLNLTAGLNTAYDGMEALYEVDETKLQDITDRQLLHVAIDYITKEGKATSVDLGTLSMLYKDEYPEIEKSGVYNAKDIREAIKTLFDIDDFANPTIEADATSLTNYIYLSEEDVYLVFGDYSNSLSDPSLIIDYSIVETTSKKDKIITTVAIGYAQVDGDKKTYATDRFGNNIVAKDVSAFPTDKIDEFTKYEFSLTKSKDGKNYIFESVKKVK